MDSRGTSLRYSVSSIPMIQPRSLESRALSLNGKLGQRDPSVHKSPGLRFNRKIKRGRPVSRWLPPRGFRWVRERCGRRCCRPRERERAITRSRPGRQRQWPQLQDL